MRSEVEVIVADSGRTSAGVEDEWANEAAESTLEEATGW
jgi:hypothetical protein